MAPGLYRSIHQGGNVQRREPWPAPREESTEDDPSDVGRMKRQNTRLHRIIEIFGSWCPLTALETWLEVRGGISAYRGPFLLHYLDALVYPDIPPNLLIAGAVAICILNLWIYARRFRARHSLG